VTEALAVRVGPPACGVLSAVGLAVHVARLRLLVGVVVVDVVVEGLAVADSSTEGRMLPFFRGCSWPVAMRRAGQSQTQQPSLPHLPSCAGGSGHSSSDGGGQAQ
jgi:hypothetical protein